MVNIPEHNCRNCGACCGPAMATKGEIVAIKAHVKSLSKKYLKLLRRQDRDRLDCQFRDKVKKCCVIYPVRPEMCKLFGVTQGMACPFGNTATLDGIELMDFKKRRYFIPKII